MEIRPMLPQFAIAPKIACSKTAQISAELRPNGLAGANSVNSARKMRAPKKMRRKDDSQLLPGATERKNLKRSRNSQSRQKIACSKTAQISAELRPNGLAGANSVNSARKMRAPKKMRRKDDSRWLQGATERKSLQRSRNSQSRRKSRAVKLRKTTQMSAGRS